MTTKRTILFRVHRKWFVRFAEGRKRHEFRADTPYWRKRLWGKEFDEVIIINGYGATRPYMRLQWLGLTTRKVKGVPLLATETGNILELRNYNPHG